MEPVAPCGDELGEYKYWTYGYFGIYRFADLFYVCYFNHCLEENAN